MSGFLDGLWREREGGRYLNRYDAGRALAVELKDKVAAFEGEGVVVGLPRGGLVVGLAVSNDLKIPLDFRSVKKVGHPMQPEFAIGAVDISGEAARNPMVDPSDMPSDSKYRLMVDKALERARQMERDLRGEHESKIESADWCLVVDDGAATGLTLLAVTKGLQAEGKKVHIGIPVSSVQAKEMLTRVAESFHALQTPQHFMAVSQFYDDFAPVTLDEAKNTLGQT